MTSRLSPKKDFFLGISHEVKNAQIYFGQKRGSWGYGITIRKSKIISTMSINAEIIS